MKTCTIFLSPSSLSRRLLHPFFLVPSFSHLLPLDHRPPPALTTIIFGFTKRSPTSPPFLFFLFCFPLLSSPIIKAITIATAIDAGDRASIDPCCCYSCCQHLTLTTEEGRTSDSHQLHPFGRPCCCFFPFQLTVTPALAGANPGIHLRPARFLDPLIILQAPSLGNH